MTYPVPQVEGLAWRPLGDDDLDAWWTLVERAQEVDRPHHASSRVGLERISRRPETRLEVNSLGGFDVDGTLRALARVAHVPGTTEALQVVLMGEVDPAWRRRGIGQQVLAWELARAGDVAREVRAADPSTVDLPVEAGVFANDGREDVAALVERAGLEPARWFASMRRDLAAHPPAAGPLPAGLTASDLEGEDAFEASLRAHNDAFRDHWGFHPETAETWEAELDEPGTSRRDLGLLLRDGDDPVAYAVTSVRPEPDGTPAGHTELLGTVRAWRGRGLASYLLERSAELFVADGLTVATLGVDSASPSGADRLYRAHGYERHGGSTYRRVLL